MYNYWTILHNLIPVFNAALSPVISPVNTCQLISQSVTNHLIATRHKEKQNHHHMGHLLLHHWSLPVLFLITSYNIISFRLGCFFQSQRYWSVSNTNHIRRYQHCGIVS